MGLINIFLSALVILLFVNIILTLRAGKKVSGNELTEIKSSIGTLTSNLKETEKNLKDEFVTNRKENAETARDLRGEIGEQLNKFTQTFSEQLGNLTKSNEEKLEAIRKTFEEKLVDFQKSIDTSSKDSRNELKENLETNQPAFQKFKKDLFENNEVCQTIGKPLYGINKYLLETNGNRNYIDSNFWKQSDGICKFGY